MLENEVFQPLLSKEITFVIFLKIGCINFLYLGKGADHGLWGKKKTDNSGKCLLQRFQDFHSAVFSLFCINCFFCLVGRESLWSAVAEVLVST